MRRIAVRGIPPKQSLDGAPSFVRRLNEADCGSCYPTEAELGWGTQFCAEAE
jgi:hypothetical protein